MRRTSSSPWIASVVALTALVSAGIAGCATTAPSAASLSAIPSPSADASEPLLTAVPGGPSLAPGAMACPDIPVCLPVFAALNGWIPNPLPDGTLLVIAPSCAPNTPCASGIHVIAVLVPGTWRLGDAATAWSVDGLEGSLTVKRWSKPSLPEHVLLVVRATVGGS
jgi:hypothetical protein